MSVSPVHPTTLYSTRAVRLQICREGAIYIHIGLQSGRWTYGSGQFDFEPQIQRETDRMFSSAMRGPSVSSVTITRDILR